MKYQKILLATVIATLLPLSACSTPTKATKKLPELTPVKMLDRTGGRDRPTLQPYDFGDEARLSTFGATSIGIDRLLESSSTEEPPVTKKEEAHVQEEILLLMKQCQPILSEFEAKSEDGAKKAFWLSIAGLISGGVISPALLAANPASNASAAAAFSSFGAISGAVGRNFESSGLSGTHAANDRNEIIKRIREHLKNVFESSDNPNKQLTSIALAKSECALYLMTSPTIAEYYNNAPSTTVGDSAPTTENPPAEGDTPTGSEPATTGEGTEASE